MRHTRAAETSGGNAALGDAADPAAARNGSTRTRHHAANIRKKRDTDTDNDNANANATFMLF